MCQTSENGCHKKNFSLSIINTPSTAEFSVQYLLREDVMNSAHVSRSTPCGIEGNIKEKGAGRINSSQDDSTESRMELAVWYN